MKTIYDLYEGIMNRPITGEIGRDLARTRTIEYFDNLTDDKIIKVNDKGQVLITHLRLKKSDFDGFPEWLEFDENQRLFGYAIFIYDSSLKTLKKLPYVKRLVITDCNNFIGFDKSWKNGSARDIIITRCNKFEDVSTIPYVEVLELNTLPKLKSLKGLTTCTDGLAIIDTSIETLDGLENVGPERLYLKYNDNLTNIEMIPTTVTRMWVDNGNNAKLRITGKTIKDQCSGLLLDRLSLTIDNRKISTLKYLK